MTYLFSAAGRAALHAFVTGSTLYAFDLDGTLAPIVDEPAGIMIQEEVQQQLRTLDRLAPVAVITGRSRADALPHLGFSPRYLVGNHGAEGLPGNEKSEDGFVRLCRGWEEQLRTLLPKAASNGIVTENKGATLSLHYRNAPDRDVVQRDILDAVSRLDPLPRRVSGKFVENLVPREALHKGDALLRVMERLGCQRAIFVGDDVTDEDVFRLENDTVLGIRVGMDTGSSASLHIHEQHEIVLLLAEIIAAIETLPAKG